MKKEEKIDILRDVIICFPIPLSLTTTDEYFPL